MGPLVAGMCGPECSVVACASVFSTFSVLIVNGERVCALPVFEKRKIPLFRKAARVYLYKPLSQVGKTG